MLNACIRDWTPGSRMRQIRAQSLAQFLAHCVQEITSGICGGLRPISSATLAAAFALATKRRRSMTSRSLEKAREA